MKRERLFDRVVYPVGLFLILIFGGAAVFSYLEGWTYLDSLYFSAVTATTVGYGDFVPITAPGKVFTIFFAFCTIGLAFYFFTLTGRYFFAKSIKEEFVRKGRLKNNKGTRVIKV